MCGAVESERARERGEHTPRESARELKRSACRRRLTDFFPRFFFPLATLRSTSDRGPGSSLALSFFDFICFRFLHYKPRRRRGMESAA